MADDLDVEALLEASLKSTQHKEAPPSESTEVRKEDGSVSSTDKGSSRSDRDSKSDSKDDKHRSKRRSKSRSKSRDRHRHKRRRHSRSRSPRDRRSRRSRSRSPRRDRRDRERDRERERERERDRGRYDDRDRRRDRRGRSAGRDDELTPEEQEAKRKQKEAEEADRDERTVFASNLPIRATESELFEFFGKAGKVHDIRLITDRNSRKSKGFGYIEYLDKSSVPIALHQLNGTQCKGQTVLVQMTQAEKNRAAAAAAAAAANAPPSLSAPTRLYVGNLPFNLTEDDLRAVFEPCGEIQFINLPTELDGRLKGHAFVQYKSPEDAKKALQHCNGMRLADRQLKVGLVSDAGGVGAAAPGVPGFGSTAPGFGGGGGGLNELDDDGGGLALNAHSRAMLMARLAGQTGVPGLPSFPGAPMGFPMPGLPGGLLPGVLPGMGLPGVGMLPGVPALGGGLSAPIMPTAPTVLPPTVAPRPAVTSSPFLLLKNMFDPAQETDANFHLDIQEDVTDEGSKYGKVLQCHVVRDSPSGLVYLKFDSPDASNKAIQAFNGRWFAGKVISAELIDENAFQAGCKL